MFCSRTSTLLQGTLLSGKVPEKTDGLGHYDVSFTYIHMIGFKLSAFINKNYVPRPVSDQSREEPGKANDD